MLKPSCNLATLFVYKYLVYNKEDSSFPAVLWSLNCPSEPSHTEIFVTIQKILFQNFSNKFWLSQKWDREVFYVVNQFYFYPSEKRTLDVDVWDNTALWCFIFLSSFVVPCLKFLLFPSFILYLFLPILLSFFFLPFAFPCIFVSFLIYLWIHLSSSFIFLSCLLSVIYSL
jgi:hypothetical protein